MGQFPPPHLISSGDVAASLALGGGGSPCLEKEGTGAKWSAVWAGPGLPDVSCRSSYEEHCRRKSLIVLHPFPHCFMLVAGTLFMALKAHTWLSVDVISWPGALSNSPTEPCLLVPLSGFTGPMAILKGRRWVVCAYKGQGDFVGACPASAGVV